MCILKGFSRFVMSSDVQNGLFFNLSPLNTTVSRKVISFSDISAVNLMVGWNLLACSILKLIHVFFISVPEGEDIVNISSLFFWLFPCSVVSALFQF